MFAHPLARGAMASELRGQNGSVILHDRFSPQKIAVMHQSLWTPSGRSDFGMAASLVDDYRLHRDDQRARAEREGLGYPEETRAFYGHPGAAPGHSSERPLMLHDYLRGMRQTRPEDMAPHEREWQRGFELGSRHAEQLDYDDDPEQVDFGEMHRQLATSPGLQRGYSHGREQMSAWQPREIGDRLQFDVATRLCR
jgi:hypothetical protein